MLIYMFSSLLVSSVERSIIIGCYSIRATLVVAWTLEAKEMA